MNRILISDVLLNGTRTDVVIEGNRFESLGARPAGDFDEVIACLKDIGVPAVTYMPTRNTPEQLARLRRLCDENGLFQVSGEDINSPRQSFIIRAMENPMFANLIDATWKLIDHENKHTPL